MSRVSYFQRFSQRENHATNNTMLLLQHVYRLGPDRLARVLIALMDDIGKLTVGPEFEQQIKGASSVPDAAIIQQAFEVWVESKLGDDLDDDQVKRHLSHVADPVRGSGMRVLIGLTRHSLTPQRIAEIQALATPLGVAFVGATYQQIVDAVGSEIRPYEPEQRAILEDYAAFLDDNGLLLVEHRWMAVFPCGVSIAENIAHRLYYEPPSRSRKRASIIGIYARKAVQHIGRVEAIVVGDWSSGDLDLHYEVGTPTADHADRVRAVVAATPYYDLKRDAVRYYLLGETEPTSIPKTSPGGIMGLRYLDLQTIVPGLPVATTPVRELAQRLSTASFE
jgi:hypothetical protein